MPQLGLKCRELSQISLEIKKKDPINNRLVANSSAGAENSMLN
jgi:hypothetical protein